MIGIEGIAGTIGAGSDWAFSGPVVTIHESARQESAEVKSVRFIGREVRLKLICGLLVAS